MAVLGPNNELVPIAQIWPKPQVPDVSIPENPVLRGILTNRPQKSVGVAIPLQRVVTTPTNVSQVNDYLKTMMSSLFQRINPNIIKTGPFYHLYRSLTRTGQY